MLKIQAEIEIRDLASELANSDDHKQSEFFEIFFASLRLSCKDDYRFNYQLSAIHDKLDERTKYGLRFLGLES